MAEQFPEAVPLALALQSSMDHIDQWVQLEDRLDREFKLDALLNFRGAGLPIVCLLPAAQPRGNRRNPAYFRWKWAEKLENVNVLVLSEPTLYAHEDLLAGWLMSPGKDLAPLVASAIRSVATGWGCNEESILLYGSSMGGFEAMQIATFLEGARCIAEVPQIDMHEYQFPEALESIEKNLLGYSIVRHRRRKPEQLNVIERFRKQSTIPRVRIITNRGDHQFSKAVRLLELELDSEDSVVNRITVDVWAESVGHRPLSRDQILPIIRQEISEMPGFEFPEGVEAATESVDQLFSNGREDLDWNRIHRLKASHSFAELRERAVAAAERVKMIRTPEDRENYKDALEILLAASYKDENQDWPLVRACSLMKRWEMGYGPQLLAMALEAWSRKQTIGSLSYVCRGILAKSDPETAREKFGEIGAQISQVELKCILGVFDAIAIYETGDFEGYEEAIRQVRADLPDGFDTYLLVPLSTVVVPKEIESENRSATTEELVQATQKITVSTGTDISYSIVTSCDPKYLEFYGKFLVESFERTASAEAILTIVVLGGEHEAQPTIRALNKISARVRYVFIDADFGENLGPASSLVRILPVANILKNTGAPVVMLDIDCVLRTDLSPLIKANQHADVALRELGQHVGPWEKYAAGVVIFYPTDIGVNIARAAAHAGASILTPGPKQWWIDQNMLEYGIRVQQKSGNNPEISNLIGQSREFMVLPTGSREAKVFALDRGIAEVRSG